MSDSRKRVRVAVIGGGCAALTTAFELTRPDRPDNGDTYEVTVYQMGWRLGGKGASGRGIADRIEEHGLHLWMGFYENAFRLMRECYAERQAAYPNCRFADWHDAFKRAPDVAVADQTHKGWEFWRAHFPPGEGEPGDSCSQGSPFTVFAYLRQSAMLIGELLRSASVIESGPARAHPAWTPLGGDAAVASEALASAADRLFRYGQLATTAAIFEAIDTLRRSIDMCFPQLFRDGAREPMRLLEALAAAARCQLDHLVAGDSELRRIWCVIDLVLAILRGLLFDGRPGDEPTRKGPRRGLVFEPAGFDAINDYDWREWLRMNGASEQSLDSGFMRGTYDLMFAYEDGEVKRPRLAAGVALRGAARMFFTYRGALFWRMNAGMGDVVFAPLYQVLKHRGVRFEFFHRLRNVKLAPSRRDESPYVSALEFDVQARINSGGEYQPLVDVRGVPSWPSRPDYQQLVNGDRLAREHRDFEGIWDRRRVASKTLRVASDFDFVVLGVSIGALPFVARELIEREPRWRDRVRHVKTVPTQSFQIWTRENVRQLGWPHTPVSLSGFVEPFDTWADMSHLIPEESWSDPVKAIAYFCGVLPDAAPAAYTRQFHLEQRERVRSNAIRFLNQDVAALWPRATHPGEGFRWDTLASEDRGLR